jgi:PIN domain nuclease of toxin-antitoxin system
MIVSTAIAEELTLLTDDRLLRAYPVPLVW